MNAPVGSVVRYTRLVRSGKRAGAALGRHEAGAEARTIRPARPAAALVLRRRPDPAARSFRWCRQEQDSPASARSYFILAMERDRTAGFNAYFSALMLAAHAQERSEAVTAYAESLPAQERGALILVLMVNAYLTLALEAAQLALVVRTLRRAAKAEDPVETILGRAISPSTATVVGASAVHKLARERFLRRLNQRVRAAERADRTR